MNAFENLLYKTGLAKPTAKVVQKWNKKQDIKAIDFAYKKGIYDIRLACLLAYVKIAPINLIDILGAAIDDSVYPVSNFAIEQLETGTITPELKKRIKDRKAYWKKRKEAEQNAKNIHISNISFKEAPSKSPTARAAKRMDEQKRMNKIGTPGL